jgi:hypothetical protein
MSSTVNIFLAPLSQKHQKKTIRPKGQDFVDLGAQESTEFRFFF